METWCWSRIGSLPAVRLQADNCGRVARSPDCQQVTRNHERLTDIHDSCLFISVNLKQLHDEMYDTAHIFIGISYGGGRGNPVRANESESRNYLVLSSVQPPKISLTEALLSPLHYVFFFFLRWGTLCKRLQCNIHKSVSSFHPKYTHRPPKSRESGTLFGQCCQFQEVKLRSELPALRTPSPPVCAGVQCATPSDS